MGIPDYKNHRKASCDLDSPRSHARPFIVASLPWISSESTDSKQKVPTLTLDSMLQECIFCINGKIFLISNDVYTKYEPPLGYSWKHDISLRVQNQSKELSTTPYNPKVHSLYLYHHNGVNLIYRVALLQAPLITSIFLAKSSSIYLKTNGLDPYSSWK